MLLKQDHNFIKMVLDGDAFRGPAEYIRVVDDQIVPLEHPPGKIIF